MSNCIVTINVNGKDLKVNLKNSSPSIFIDEDLINALSTDQINTIVDGIRIQSINTGLKSVKLKDLQKDGIQANCSLQYLRDNPKYWRIQFPEGNANILLIKNLVLGGKPISGRIINSNGEEIFITNGTEDDIEKLSNFLKIRNSIRNYGLNLSDESPYYTDLNELKELKKLSSIEDVLLDYLDNKKKYLGIGLKSGQSALVVLESVTRGIKNWNIPNIFDDQFITNVNWSIYTFDNKSSFIHYDSFYKLLKQYHKSLLDALGITSLDKFKAYGKNKEFKDAFIAYDKDSESLISEAKNGIEAIINYTFSTEPEFNYSFVKVSKKGIFLKSEYTPISQKYSIAYNTIQEMKRSSYRGYFIYERTLANKHKQVFISRGTLNENGNNKPFKSVKDAQTSIDTMLSKQFLRKNSLIEFKYRDSVKDDKGETIYDDSLPRESVKSTVYFKQGSIVESIDIPINSKTNIRGEEQALFQKSTIKDFQALVNTWNISNKAKKKILELDTPEKVVTFIYKMNELLGTEERTNSKVMSSIVDTIEAAGHNYYYIEHTQNADNSYIYSIIPTTLDSMSTADAPPNLPVITWMSAIAEALKTQFNVEVNLLTSEQIKEQNLADPNTDKAFIRDGQVYVNTTIASTTDLLHEYVHLILGVLKSNPELRANYERLLNAVALTEKGKKELNRLRERYSDHSEMDLREEVFAKLFSKYIRGDISINTPKIFDEVKEATKTIFNTNINDIKDFYNQSIFSGFRKDISRLLANKDIDFGITGESRKVSNWVSKQIKDGNITEQC